MKTVVRNGRKRVFYEPADIASLIGCEPRTVRNLCRSGMIRAVSGSLPGSRRIRWLIPEAEVRRLAAQLAAPAKADR
jgi:hypothetical protein